jgi:hypothetical protein
VGARRELWKRLCARVALDTLPRGRSSAALGDALDALVNTLVWTLLLLVPCAVLTAAGVLLWRRWRSIATAMIALGFAATVVSLASGLFGGYRTHAVLVDLTSAPLARQDTFFVLAHYHRFLPTLGLLGIWVAAAGTLWHVRRQH